MLPNFFVIGAYKSGTTSLYQYLSQHPQVFVPRVKEPNFFAFAADDAEDRSRLRAQSVTTLEEYEALYETASHSIAVGDVSPEYMTCHTAARSIRSMVPHAKLIAILRNPVERAYSDYLMYRRDGREQQTSFAEALEKQPERAARGDPTGSYISTGYYGQQLARYYDLFPAAQIGVFLMEDLQADGPRTLSRIFEFLGVDPTFVPDNLAIHNRSGVASNVLVSTIFRYRTFLAPLARRLLPSRLRLGIRRRVEDYLTKPPLPPQVTQMLNDIYRPDVLLLEQLTGRSFMHWLT